ncbi:response regulator [Bacillus infantis]|uniref:Response regulator n=1 Tax=Bacillus infantis TaxID=324767 RepID=A0A5D4RL05_9BACI|nr:response regulator [Bacillus infantis]TYS52145.1 response regulator [Bacillus infantis]
MIKAIIAEDDYRVADIHEQFIEKINGIECIGKALNAAEALKLLEETEADLLLMDIYMPDELGSSLLPRIRESFSNIEVIMITASNEKQMVEESLRYGVIDYMIKPVTFERFSEAIRKVNKKRDLLECRDSELTQEAIDYYLSSSSASVAASEKMPKGIDSLTLRKVKEILEEMTEGVNAEELGKEMGASRTTARRYLEYLVASEEAKAELEYGIVGRPERKYYRL